MYQRISKQSDLGVDVLEAEGAEHHEELLLLPKPLPSGIAAASLQRISKLSAVIVNQISNEQQIARNLRTSRLWTRLNRFSHSLKTFGRPATLASRTAFSKGSGPACSPWHATLRVDVPAGVAVWAEAV